jgi:hypothetical protein
MSSIASNSRLIVSISSSRRMQSCGVPFRSSASRSEVHHLAVLIQRRYARRWKALTARG